MSTDTTCGVQQARVIAMRLLATREHTRLELTRKLTQRGCSEAITQTTIDALANEGLQSDARYAQTFVRLRAARGYGSIAIKRDLQQRGIEHAMIADAFAEEAIHWEQLACDVRQKKFGVPLPKTPADKAKQQRFLQYRGFTHDEIRLAIQWDNM